MGIVPGKTTVGEARQRMEAINTLSSEYAVIIEDSSSNRHSFALYRKAKPAEMLGIVMTTQTNAVIDTISFLFPFDIKRVTPTIADWHMLFGVPSHLVWSTQSPDWTIIFGDDQRGAAVVSMFGNYSSWEELTWSVVFYEHTARIPAEETYPWPGFTRRRGIVPCKTVEAVPC
jgi:hypothetical protein